MKYTNLKDLFLSFNDEKYSSKTMTYLFSNDPNSYPPIFSKTYKDCYRDVLLLIDRFIGFNNDVSTTNEGSILALVGTNSYEWIIGFWAGIMSGHKMILIDPNSTKEQIFDLFKLMNVNKLIASTEVIKKLELSLESSIKTICYNDKGKMNDRIISFYDIFNPLIGKRDYENIPKKIIEKVTSLDFDSKKEIIFMHTSGTTGQQKCVGLSSSRIMSNFDEFNERGQLTDKDTILSILPNYHVYGLLCSFLISAYNHCQCSLLREISSTNIMKAIKMTDVSIIPAVPAFWKLLYQNIYQEIKKNNTPEGQKLKIYIDSLSIDQTQKTKLESPNLLSPIKEKLGKHLRIFFNSGAKIDLCSMNFFSQMGITCLNGYGLTETAGGFTSTSINDKNIETVGKIIGDNDVIIKNKNMNGIGEIWVTRRSSL